MSIVARDRERLDAAAATLVAAAGDATRVASESSDVSDAPSLRAAIGRLGEALGPVDVLVTSAGYAHPGLFVDLDDEVFERQMAVDYFGTLHAIRAVVPSMVERAAAVTSCSSRRRSASSACTATARTRR